MLKYGAAYKFFLIYIYEAVDLFTERGLHSCSRKINLKYFLNNIYNKIFIELNENVTITSYIFYVKFYIKMFFIFLISQLQLLKVSLNIIFRHLLSNLLIYFYFSKKNYELKWFYFYTVNFKSKFLLCIHSHQVLSDHR